MLYVFHVDNGVMLILEMDLALTCVKKLKEVICEKTGIFVEKQVLLISGGDALDDNADVCHYSAGTDTNPIFLFSLSAIEYFERFSYCQPEHDYVEDPDIRALDADIKEQVETCVTLPPTRNTLLARACLAQKIFENSRDQLALCDESVHHQHLQQQGWAAVVANLEDILIAVTRLFEVFEKKFLDYLKMRRSHIELLHDCDTDFALLRTIPLLEALNAQRKVWPTLSIIESSKERSLFDWIDNGDLEKKLEISLNKLAKFDLNFFNDIQVEFRAIMAEGQNRPEMKEIMGLGERLSQLDNLMREGKKSLEDQKFFTEAFYLNKTRTSKDGDPELCDTQINHMRMMHSSFAKISDIRKRCHKAKTELSANIVRRLHWIMHVEGRVNSLESSIRIHIGNLKKLEEDLVVFESLHQSPKLYFSSISEIVRRRAFSKRFKQWANQLSSESREIWDKEVYQRRRFNNHLSFHFLQRLFPSLNDLPPPFATERPDEFDEDLPQVTSEDLDYLRASVPDLAPLLLIEDDPRGAVPPMLEATLRSNENTNTLTPSSNEKEAASGELFASAATSPPRGSLRTSPDKSEDAIASPQKGNVSRPSSLVRDQPESETDTEEFEKVCGSISDGTYSPMESVPEMKGAKTKHPFPCQPTDSKHIKLDSSHRGGDVPVTSGASSARLAPDTGTDKKPCSPCDCLLSPASQLSPEEFVSPDFYIDESMPSSYTESTGTTTTTSSGANRQHTHAHHLHVKSHHVITAELQKQIDEKNMTLSALQADLENSKVEIETLQTRLNTLASLSYETVVHDLRKEMESLKDKVKVDGSSYLGYISQISTRLLEILEKIQKETEASHELAVKSALTAVQSEEDQRRNTLMAQLFDANRELEIYQEQTRSHITQIERLKCRIEEERLQLVAEKEESVKKLTLEHELEMEALKEQWHNEEQGMTEELSSLREKILSLETLLEKTLKEKQNLDKEYEERYEAKFKEWEESICQILGASYSERERKNLEVQKEDLQRAFDSDKLRILEEHQETLKQQLEELRKTMQKELDERLTKEHKEADDRHQEELRKCRDLWEAQKEEEVEGLREEMKAQLQADCEQKLEIARVQYKMDLEGLRSRFRMMTTASMDKSPSETSLEKFERGDFVEAAYHDVVVERLREEMLEEKKKAIEDMRLGLEEKHRLVVEDERRINDEKRKEESKRIEAEKQEMFNAAFKEVSEDKGRVIEDLRLRVEFLTEETEKLRKASAKAHEGPLARPVEVREWQERCERYKQDVDRLEKELQRARRLSFISERHPDMSSSDGSSTSSTLPMEKSNSELLQKLHQENKEFKSALVRSLSERKKISLDDAQMHDFVLVVWDELYCQYRILLENQPILHFLHSDSYAALGLSKGAEKPPENKLFCSAQVTKKKEFCQAKRDGNRFNVRKGTKFYRVEAGPCNTLKEDVERESVKGEYPPTRRESTRDPTPATVTPTTVEEGAEGNDSGSC